MNNQTFPNQKLEWRSIIYVNEMRERIIALLKQIGAGMHEREHILAIALLGAISGQNTFLFGPPGTAKSLISRRLSLAFSDNNYFECLMNRFTTPEEIFGPISIKALKEDRYIRQVEGYLPTADFAFLDEIWKSSPAILNNLLTIINEGLFKNGDESLRVPLKSLIAASNEILDENQGLEALYDRFILRVLVPPIQNQKNFELLVSSKPNKDKIEVDEELKIKPQELVEWRDEINNIKLSDITLKAIQLIRENLNELNGKLNIYVSDRRWQRAAMLLKAAAFCNGREETDLTDITLLKYCLWTTPENRGNMNEIIDKCISSSYETSNSILKKAEDKIEKIEKEIQNKFYYNEDNYKTVKLSDGKDYICINAEFKYSEKMGNIMLSMIGCRSLMSAAEYQLYKNLVANSDIDGLRKLREKFKQAPPTKLQLFIPEEDVKTRYIIRVYDNNLNLIDKVTGVIEKGLLKITSYFIKGCPSHFYQDLSSLNLKGTKKDIRGLDLNKLDKMRRDIQNLKNKLSKELLMLEKNKYDEKNGHKNPFLVTEDSNKENQTLEEQVEKAKILLQDCERIEKLC